MFVRGKQRGSAKEVEVGRKVLAWSFAAFASEARTSYGQSRRAVLLLKLTTAEQSDDARFTGL